MSTEGTYYVPDQSKLPIFAATGMGVMAYGAASWVLEGGTATIFLIGSLIMAAVLYKWWSIVIDENMRGLASPQLKQSYVLGMLWFIFSEVMFFACFFGALFYVRVLVSSWIGVKPQWDGSMTRQPMPQQPMPNISILVMRMSGHRW